MAWKMPHGLWDLVRRQHNAVARRQLLALGVSARWIELRLAEGWLHRVYPGVYLIGRTEPTRLGRLSAAVLACGPDAALSHESAAALWGLLAKDPRELEVSVPVRRGPRRAGIVVHRRRKLERKDVTKQRGIPVTSPVRTLIDVATRRQPRRLEAMINEADALGLVSAESLREALEDRAGEPGVPALRAILDRDTFVLTGSELERMFLPIARQAGLPKPTSQSRLGPHRVDFHWPDIKLVVETNGLRYHRTPIQQAEDHRRAQAHARAGLTCLQFTHDQVAHDRKHVERVLRDVASRAA